MSKTTFHKVNLFKQQNLTLCNKWETNKFFSPNLAFQRLTRIIRPRRTLNLPDYVRAMRCTLEAAEQTDSLPCAGVRGLRLFHRCISWLDPQWSAPAGRDEWTIHPRSRNLQQKTRGWDECNLRPEPARAALLAAGAIINPPLTAPFNTGPSSLFFRSFPCLRINPPHPALSIAHPGYISADNNRIGWYPKKIPTRNRPFATPSCIKHGIYLTCF